MANKTIVITGASAGIGAELARRLAADGHQPRPRRAASARARARRRATPSARGVAARHRRRRRRHQARRRRSARATRRSREFGGFDVWINNAGRGITRSVLELTDDDVDEMMAVNVKSALYGMQIAARHFIERGHGQIINVSSFLGRVPLATHRSAYNAAKAALNALTANLRVDLRATHPEHSRHARHAGHGRDRVRRATRSAAPPGHADLLRTARADPSSRSRTSSRE